MIGPPPEENEKRKDFTWKPQAPARRGYTDEQVQEILQQAAEHLEKKFPAWEFRLVELGPANFNIVFDRVKDVSTIMSEMAASYPGKFLKRVAGADCSPAQDAEQNLSDTTPPESGSNGGSASSVGAPTTENSKESEEIASS